MLAAVPQHGGHTRRVAEGPGGPASHQALSEQRGHAWPQLAGQQLQAAGGSSASEECGCQEAGSRCCCCWTRLGPFRSREALPGMKIQDGAKTLYLDHSGSFLSCHPGTVNGV